MIFSQLTNSQLLAILMIGEASDQGLDGMVGVASVVRSRVRANQPKWFGTGWMGVILRNTINQNGVTCWQFDCFRPGTANNDRIVKIAGQVLKDETNRVFDQAEYLAIGIINGQILDNVMGSDHYCRFDSWPAWRKVYQQVAQIRDHVFCRSHNWRG